MYSLYKFTDKPMREQLLYKSDKVKSEYHIIIEYFDSIGSKIENYRHLGELRGMVYRVNFKLTVDGVEGEYMVIHNTL